RLLDGIPRDERDRDGAQRQPARIPRSERHRRRARGAPRRCRPEWRHRLRHRPLRGAAVRGRAAARDRTGAGWAKRLSAVTVRTPDPAFDAMLNRWALYQALACRLWGRSAFYQSSGGYGFPRPPPGGLAPVDAP